MWYFNLQNFFSVLQFSIIFTFVENYHKRVKSKSLPYSQVAPGTVQWLSCSNRDFDFILLLNPFMVMISIGCPQKWCLHHWQTLNKLQMDFCYDYSRRIKEVRLHPEIKVPKQTDFSNFMVYQSIIRD